MSEQAIHTFFSMPYSVCNTVDQVLDLMKRIPAKAEVILLQDSTKPLSAPLKKAVEATNGQLVRIRTSGPWNKLWKLIQEVEIARTVSGKYCESGEIWIISMVPTAEVHAAMRRHRVINNITNREAFWIKTLPFGEEHDEIIAMTLNTELGYVTDKRYADLTAFECFELSAFEGLRFMRPCHDVATCASIMAGYNPPVPAPVRATKASKATA